MDKKFGVKFARSCGFRVMRADRQTDVLVAIFLVRLGGRNITTRWSWSIMHGSRVPGRRQPCVRACVREVLRRNAAPADQTRTVSMCVADYITTICTERTRRLQELAGPDRPGLPYRRQPSAVYTKHETSERTNERYMRQMGDSCRAGIEEDETPAPRAVRDAVCRPLEFTLQRAGRPPGRPPGRATRNSKSKA